jgi:hypothetical protein
LTWSHRERLRLFWTARDAYRLNPLLVALGGLFGSGPGLFLLRLTLLKFCLLSVTHY